MSIINVFKSKVTSLLKESEQNASEKLIELATFFYKIDNRISLEEQQYIDELLATIEWNSSIAPETFQRECICKINGIVAQTEEQISAYLSVLMQEIAELGAADKAKTMAKEISDADGEVADDETKYLDLVMSF